MCSRKNRQVVVKRKIKLRRTVAQVLADLNFEIVFCRNHRCKSLNFHTSRHKKIFCFPLGIFPFRNTKFKSEKRKQEELKILQGCSHCVVVVPELPPSLSLSPWELESLSLSTTAFDFLCLLFCPRCIDRRHGEFP